MLCVVHRVSFVGTFQTVLRSPRAASQDSQPARLAVPWEGLGCGTAWSCSARNFLCPLSGAFSVIYTWQCLGFCCGLCLWTQRWLLFICIIPLPLTTKWASTLPYPQWECYVWWAIMSFELCYWGACSGLTLSWNLCRGSAVATGNRLTAHWPFFLLRTRMESVSSQYQWFCTRTLGGRWPWLKQGMSSCLISTRSLHPILMVRLWGGVLVAGWLASLRIL